MSRKYVPGKHYHRMVPCPYYEISKIENWLSGMAEEGLLLEEDGIFAGIATFGYKGPQKVRYRLEVVQGGSENGPDPEQLEISERYSWEYIAKLRAFYIFRSSDPDARELNTDPEVRAMALNAVKKRARSSLIWSLIKLIVYPALLTRGCFLLSTLSMGTWWMLAALVLCALIIAGELHAFVHLRRLWRSLMSGETCDEDSDVKKEKKAFLAGKLAETLLGIFLVCMLLRAWGVSVTGENKIPLKEYGGALPFSTITDFAGEGYSDYAFTMTGLSEGFNTVEERSDLLAPRMIEYNEQAAVTKADGDTMDCGLYVEYLELRSPALARLCAKELLRLDKLRKGFRLLETPELDADFTAAYMNFVHFQTVIIQKGSTVIKAQFHSYQTSSYQMPLEEWSRIVCGSIG